jgi:hypothetical protein
MRTFPNLFFFGTCNNYEFGLYSIVNYDSLILTVCYKNVKFYISLQYKIKLQ